MNGYCLLERVFVNKINFIKNKSKLKKKKQNEMVNAIEVEIEIEMILNE